jgi:hypothetical protein
VLSIEWTGKETMMSISVSLGETMKTEVCFKRKRAEHTQVNKGEFKVCRLIEKTI